MLARVIARAVSAEHQPETAMSELDETEAPVVEVEEECNDLPTAIRRVLQNGMV